MNSDYKTTQLDQFILQIRGVSYKKPDISNEPKEGFIPLLKANNIQNGEIILDELVYVNKDIVKERQLLKPGDILIAASSGSKHIVGKSGQIKNINYNQITFGAFCKVIRPKDNINPDYLNYFFKTSYYSTYISNIINGSNINNLRNEHIDKLVIPSPSLQKQNEITVILGKAKRLINYRIQQITALSDLEQSIFIDMFGNPTKNQLNWETKRWNEIFDTKTGKLNSNAMDENGKYPFFTCSKEVFSINSFSYDQEALLLAGNNAAGKYDVKHYKGKFDAYQRTYIISLRDNNNKYEFFKVLLESKLEELQKSSLGSNTKYLTMKILNNLEFIIPPASLQREFTDRMKSIEYQKKKLENSLNYLEKLFVSLRQMAFSGELV